ncbi:DUF2066 domain-containing protein [Shewanella pneumatophori]|uniref:DUF2066 domain-containing protein n=1 Tax=Shewanella pneumatophori TaxID=314092 RepID=A0A9X1Z8E4_9GAMM|nr:DUF2066 domain-containing protein [Shewanella pneumatophori]MCL1137429.1 DUF2066 domain-containing protein [Shewanella pneumatophori]
MLKLILRICVIFCSLTGFTATAMAAEVKQLDEGIVPIETRSTTLRTQGIKQAFENVILKNSGTQSALTNERIKQQLGSASSLMTQYGYFEQDGELFLKVNFDHKRIIALLREAGLPVWGKQRPLTIVWLVAGENGEREILNDASDTVSRTTFNQESEAKGVPLLFPLMDLDDAMRVGVNDIRGRFADNVASASLRYQANYSLLATIEQQGAVYRYQMDLYPREKAPQALQMTSLVSQSGEASSMEEAVKAIVAATSEYYVGQYAVADSGQKNSTTIIFTDVAEMQQLVSIERYLSQLSAIKSARVANIQGQSVEFNIDLFGDEADLHRLMALDPRIDVINSLSEQNSNYSSFDPVEQPQKETQIYYWKGQ